MPALAVVASLSPFDIHWSLYPRTYVAPRIPSGIIEIDGDLTKDAWSNAPWSEDFDDIRGPNDAPPDERPRPTTRTRVKMMWDDKYLYIGALLTSDFTTVATYTEHNSPIFQRDSDFEVFIDPVGSCRNYKEFEMNALNTVWNLMIDRPYSDGGAEHSGRIAQPGNKFYYEVKHQRSATRVLEGRLNDPNRGATYSVEIAMAQSDLLARIPEASPPSIGKRWRINFSRVERKGKINWTWQPQVTWDVPLHCFAGHVDMHRPDAWGYLVFGPEQRDRKENDLDLRDSTWPPRLAAMNVYYAQHHFYEATGSYASTLQDLSRLLNQAIIEPFQIEITSPVSPNDPFYERAPRPQFVVVVKGNPDGSVVTVTDTRFIEVSLKESDEEGDTDDFNR